MNVELFVVVVAVAAIALLAFVLGERLGDATLIKRIKQDGAIVFPAEVRPLPSIQDSVSAEDEVEWFVWRELNECRLQGSRELWKYWSALRRQRAIKALSSEEYALLLKKLLAAYDEQWKLYLAGSERLYGRDRVMIWDGELHPYMR